MLRKKSVKVLSKSRRGTIAIALCREVRVPISQAVDIAALCTKAEEGQTVIVKYAHIPGYINCVKGDYYISIEQRKLRSRRPESAVAGFVKKMTKRELLKKDFLRISAQWLGIDLRELASIIIQNNPY